MAPAQTSGNQLAIWECIGSGSNCAWDNAHTPSLNVKYRIVSSGAAGNLTLAVD